MINWARVVRDPTVTSSIGQFAAVQSASRTFGVEVIPLGGRDAEDIERTIVEFAAGSNRGLISVAIPLTITHRSLIISLAARHRLPATYPFFVTDGGLVCYGLHNGKLPGMSIASSRAKSPPTCPYRAQPNSNWRSISKRRRRSASPCRLRCSPAPMR
jgi:hypothetical protein